MNSKPKTLLLAILSAALFVPTYVGATGDTRDILITPNDGAAPDVEYDEPEAAINTKDLLIEQANLYNISPGNGGRHGQHHGTRQRTSVSLWVNDHDNTYNIGENIIFYAKAKRDGYLTIIDVGTSGKVRQLFPNRYQPESIYGNSAKNFNDDIFPGYNADAETLTKDINVELNQSGHHQDWQTYNKVIYIRDGGYGGNHGSGNRNPAAQAERDLHLGASTIRAIQMRLRDDGYYRGSLDGAIGPETRRALRNWQRDHNLDVSGYIDGNTYAALMN